MKDLLMSLQGNWLGLMVTRSTWIYAACEALHFIGLFVLVGGVAVLDLRVLGLAKDLPVAPLHRLLPLALAGFGINLITGILFFSVDPLGFGTNPSFRVKMLLILLAGLNALWFELGFSGKLSSWGAGVDAPLQAKFICGLSLLLWSGVITAGRFLPAFALGL